MNLKLLKQPKSLTFYICCLVILDIHISLIYVGYAGLCTPFQNCERYKLKMRRITINAINDTMEEVPSKVSKMSTLWKNTLDSKS